ncbi:glycosyltransferase [Flavobacterium sp. NKUCC04_CG]|uniref:glycosyltransferase n=1 Tax=Flavobacterium sp. NKUCC04_CG TaxID=2842121 RepID=UPI001C5B3FE4|nr:glycosyltransferase [Flavobacterium sp. NKUCC04_CG]MBW3518022.1 glycosyltransferase [Flavobacterium sp. NKUCC04_CG]
MLSILIVSYNYSLYTLVKRLQIECVSLGVEFEILCSDDNSNNHYKNESIEQLEHCHYFIQPINIGRSLSRNFLINKAQFDSIIMLDSDTLPAQPHFIKNYLDLLVNQNKTFINGGLQYHQDGIPKNEMLRWVYGKSREAISASVRNLNPYSYALCSNICFSKKSINNIRFNNKIRDYGYEDLVFYKDLQKNQIDVFHVDNPVYHLKLELSQVFLNKTKISIENLNKLWKSGVIVKRDTSLLKTFYLINFFYLQRITTWLFLKTEGFLLKNLLSEKPSVLLFDLYKLGYFCSLQTSK